MQLGDRMKLYESQTQGILVPRTPAIIRIDGRAFHTFTRSFEKPFDEELNLSFRNATVLACKEIGNCKFAYHQSDEISFLLTDYDNLESQQWFGGKIQKICSVAASIYTNCFSMCNDIGYPTFDARVFSLPKEEVGNYFWWRYQDALRNSINALAQSLYSHKELQGMSCNQVSQMIFDDYSEWPEEIMSNFQRQGAIFLRDDIQYTWKCEEIKDRDIRELANERI